ncbi:MAG: GAP family protein [Candidatus Aenigmarchaeota archaeon]|nr:GAP family protein [Candidatus Aenigmarchaeota archaeon]
MKIGILFTLAISSIILLLSITAFADNSICVYFFYGEGCPHCANAEAYIHSIEAKYPNLDVHILNAVAESELLIGMYNAYDVPKDMWGAVPILFIGDAYFLGDTSIIANLEAEILDCVVCDCPQPAESSEVSLPQVLGLAAVDAVNPCELAVLVILMTAILTRFPKEKKKALKVGLSFTSAIFIMYFAFGLLIIYGFKFLTSATQLSGSWFYILLGGIAIILGIVNIKDAIWYGGGGFIMEVPMRWRPRMKSIIQGTTSIKGAFLVGLVVSFFLTPCTAGPYFVAGGILSGISIINALPYLLLYMMIFISPMLAITLIVYSGFKAVENISSWREKNLKTLHWIAGLILLVLGIAMVLRLI